MTDRERPEYILGYAEGSKAGASLTHEQMQAKVIALEQQLDLVTDWIDRMEVPSEAIPMGDQTAYQTPTLYESLDWIGKQLAERAADTERLEGAAREAGDA